MKAGSPHVGIDEQYTRTAERERHRDVARRRRLAPSSGWALVTAITLVAPEG